MNATNVVPLRRASVTLNEGQARALSEITAAYAPGNQHLLTGFAGSGKTTLMQALARWAIENKRSITMSAPTNKAVQVLERKIREAGLDVPCQTIHSLLSLSPDKKSEKLSFSRRKNAAPIRHQIVVIDEVSMIESSLMRHIDRHLAHCFVALVGDPAQLPPVGERESEAFHILSRSHLDTIVRQAAGNPILDATRIIRENQNKPDMDWSWVKSAKAHPFGVYRPGPGVDKWMQKAFTSAESYENPDAFRYLAYRNVTVEAVNAKVRMWRYGKTEAPFSIGEMALMKAPMMQYDIAIYNTGDEVKVLDIRSADFEYLFPSGAVGSSWTACIPAWRMVVVGHDGVEREIHAPKSYEEKDRVLERAAKEARGDRDRWHHFYDFKNSLADLQPIYALTIHSSQGSTFRHVFLNIPDVRRRLRDNPLETKQLFYVAASRPTDTLILVE
jgi:exodeoxyribonuclease-5